MVRLLFVGDIHLGRRPTGLPANLRELGVEPADLTPAAAWRATVAAACKEEVDAVVLAGDVVDHHDDRFEAYSQLAAGVQTLCAAGIGVFAVVGNHDFEVLPRLARQIPAVKLLGPGGTWTTEAVRDRSGGRARLLGWSFPTEHFPASPLATLRGFVPEPGVATLGVLHCDLGASGSDYAPVTRGELEAVPVEGWFLGHVHKPAALEGAASPEHPCPRPLGYLGSLIGLDPGEGERGLHGPCLVEVEESRLVSCRRLPLAPLRYELEELPLAPLDAATRVAGIADAAGSADAAASPAALEEAFTQQLFAAFDRIGERMGAAARASCKVVACRLRLTGRTRHHAALRRLLAAIDWPARPVGSTRFVVEKIEDEGATALDLEELARGNSPPALVARRLVALQRGEESEFVAEAARSLAEAAGRSLFDGLAPPPLDAAAVRGRLTRALQRLLDELQEQDPAVQPKGVAPDGDAGT